jgi:competence protein ComEC
LSVSAQSGYYCDAAVIAAAFLCLLFSCFTPKSRLFPVCSALVFFLWGLSALQPWLSPEISPDAIQTKVSDTPVMIEGVITARPSVAPEGSRLIVAAEQIIRGEHAETVSGLLLLFVSEGDVTVSRGDRIRFISRISIPRRLGLPGEFD